MISFVKRGKDTSDATATANDILEGKTAYVDNEKIVGNIETEYTPLDMLNYNIPISSTDKFKYVGNNYVVIVTSTGIINVYKLESNSTAKLLTSYTMSTSGFSFNADSIKRGDISAYSLTDNDIKLVFPMVYRNASTFFYFRFDCITNQISYVASLALGCGTWSDSEDNHRVIFPKKDSNHLIVALPQQYSVVGGYHQYSNSSAVTILDINKTSLSQKEDIFEQTYSHILSNAYFLNNDSIFCFSTPDNETNENTLFINYFSSAFELIKTQKIVTGTDGDLYISQELNYGILGNNIYSITFDEVTNTITKGDLLGNLPDNETFVGFINNSYLLCYNANVDKYSIYKITNNEISEALINHNRIDINKDEIGFSSINLNSNFDLYTNADLLSEHNQELTSLIVNNKKYYNITNINTSSSNVLSEVAFVNSNGKQYGTMPNNGDVTIIPTIEQQTKSSGYYNSLTVEAVTNDIDSNITPDNIKKDISILGVTGTLEALDTSDANATSDDIVEGKIAYVNGQKIIGGLSELALDKELSEVSIANNVENQKIRIVSYFGNGQTMFVNPQFLATSIINYSDIATAIGLTADKIKSGETILGITGTYTGDEDAPVPPEAETPPDSE